MKTKNLLLSLVVVIALFFSSSIVESAQSLYLKNVSYGLQTGNQQVYKTKQADYVMLGDSITYNVQWNELLGVDVVNRGIGGDYTEGMIHRLNLIIKLKPKKVFIMAGINDLLWASSSPEKVYGNYKTIIETLLKSGITPVITSTLYVDANVNKRHKSINGRIERLNGFLSKYADIKKIVFIDLNKSLAPNKVLPSKYTVDGVHLNGAGYEVWGCQILNYIK